MTYYAQLDSINDEFCIADCGMIYVFVCFIIKNKEQNISDIATVMKLLPPLSRNTCPIKQRRQRNRSLKAYPKCKITIFRTLFDSVIYILPQRYSQVRRQTACLIKHKFISSKPLSSYLIYKIYSSRAGPGGQSVVNLIRHACIL